MHFSEEYLKELLKQGEPVYLFVDMAYLPYLPYFALPDSLPSLRKIRELKIESNKIFETQGLESLEKLKKINQDLNALIKRATNELQEEKVVTAILENIRQKN